nr:hypothetical protein [Planctomycetota bacterium]
RRGLTNHTPIVENSAFKPVLRGVPYAGYMPAAYRQLLVENGILNADFTPNEAMAVKLGWQLVDPAQTTDR